MSFTYEASHVCQTWLVPLGLTCEPFSIRDTRKHDPKSYLTRFFPLQTDAETESNPVSSFFGGWENCLENNTP